MEKDTIKKDIFCYQEYKFLIDSIKVFQDDMIDTFGKNCSVIQSFTEKTNGLIKRIEDYIYDPAYNDLYYHSSCSVDNCGHVEI